MRAPVFSSGARIELFLFSVLLLVDANPQRDSNAVSQLLRLLHSLLADHIHHRQAGVDPLLLAVLCKLQHRIEGFDSKFRSCHRVVLLGVGRVQADGNHINMALEQRRYLFAVDQVPQAVGVDPD